ncbi:hypothetical protein GMORB2_5007 [Geosmithia morbida]|uniref:Ubiquitin 3 binding protein But2 C-terminal domain-containing protein n=1 Tax=Geosmithia morbida TaxID=1094350 RepID=A0A9P4YWE9_9HYPO|nr:uncharacterized protein GMORB2_5007 [Geosmithia morbida]KAF4124341.1 hypothetical protein GMORB2_5007 [Geosmithia morbida]
MLSSMSTSSSSKYAPLSSNDDGYGSSKAGEKQRLPTASSKLPRLILYFSSAVALLSTVNVALLPATLSAYRAYPLSESELEALPHGDARVGLDRATDLMPPPQIYERSWPDRIARVSRKLKTAVWGQGVDVHITVEDSTIVRFPVPSGGVDTCALSWRPPPEFSARVEDLTTKGDVTEIEVWQLIAPQAGSDGSPSGMDGLDYDTLSYSTLPVRGELLGVLDLTASPNSTTVDFACPGETDTLVTELRCQRVACHVSFLQVDMVPRFGFELVRRGK